MDRRYSPGWNLRTDREVTQDRSGKSQGVPRVDRGNDSGWTARVDRGNDSGWTARMDRGVTQDVLLGWIAGKPQDFAARMATRCN